eukprot:m.1269389 g.1269389  ORF g.1269389 m.1269389 type:complete len:245 (+) comp24746_c0_seq51:134-868(+)
MVLKHTLTANSGILFAVAAVCVLGFFAVSNKECVCPASSQFQGLERVVRELKELKEHVQPAETGRFGLARSFRNGTIDGEQYVFVGTSAGIATVAVGGGAWNLIPSPKGAWNTPMSVALDGSTSVVAGCLGGVVWLGTIRNATSADFTELPAITCAVVAINPNDKSHFLYSNATGWQTWESTDGGRTVHNLHHPTGSFYVAIDRQGWYYTGAEAGAYRSMDRGKTWQAYVVQMVWEHVLIGIPK